MATNKEALVNLFNGLAEYGKQENGGLTRLTWSPEFKGAQDFLKEYMEKIGMTCQVDAFGNLIGTYPGAAPEEKAICCGSHLDTVPNGGAFDGALGIVAGLSCMYRWHRAGFVPKRPVKIIAFAEEEGTLVVPGCRGSAYLMGELAGRTDQEINTANGAKDKTLSQLTSQFGLQGDPLAAPTPLQGACFVEMHIEQGHFLEEAAKPLGIVTAIVGIKRFTLAVKGEANHAGTTTMGKRRDALVAISSLVTYLYSTALTAKDRYVATVGHITISPNVENVVPGSGEFTVEIRAEDMAVIEAVKADLLDKGRQVAAEYGVAIELVRENNIQPVPMDPGIVALAEETATVLEIPYKRLPSWAGHDAMIMAKYMPTAMLFVPSKGGLSHSPEEWTSMEEIELAVQALDKILQDLAVK